MSSIGPSTKFGLLSCFTTHFQMLMMSRHLSMSLLSLQLQNVQSQGCWKSMNAFWLMLSTITWNFSITNSIVALRSHFPLPGFGKRALQCYDIFCILDHWRPRCYCSTCSETEGRLQLHFPNGCQCKYTILFNFLANTPSERST